MKAVTFYENNNWERYMAYDDMNELFSTASRSKTLIISSSELLAILNEGIYWKKVDKILSDIFV